MPELAKRVLGDGPLYREFLLGEADEEAIVPPEAYADLRRDRLALAARGRRPGDGRSRRDGQQQLGRGGPTLPLRPADGGQRPAHRVRGGVVLVRGPSLRRRSSTSRAWPTSACRPSCSAATSGSPGASPTTSARCATCTRNGPTRRIPAASCSTAAGSRRARRWRSSASTGPSPDRSRSASRATARSWTRSCPRPATETGPVALKWLGADHGGWLTALLAMDRAGSVAEFREALRPWHVPTFNLVVADVDGHIAVQCAGRIPLRKTAERGYRPGWDPEHQWHGLIPFEAMPHWPTPPAAGSLGEQPACPRRFPVSAVGHVEPTICIAPRPADDRSGPVREPAGIIAMHRTPFLRGPSRSVPQLLACPVRPHRTSRSRSGKAPRSTGTSAWRPTVWGRRSSTASSRTRSRGRRRPIRGRCALARGNQGPRGPPADRRPAGWFPEGEREAAICDTFRATLDRLTKRFGADMTTWVWGRLHTLPLRARPLRPWRAWATSRPWRRGRRRRHR